VNPPFSGWREGFRFYAPPLLAAAVLPLVSTAGWALGLAAFLLLAGLAVAAFFRDFPRSITARENEIVSPADGTVVDVAHFDASPHYEGPCLRIAIFLSVFNAHVNRAPYPCTVREVRYAPGRFIDARDPDCSKVNESNAVWLDTPAGPMTVRQISGAVARRIVCPVTPGTALAKGEKFGMIRFGSRTELFLPPAMAANVAPGQKVHAGLSVLARLPEAP
jgi:phosphatidylserine decarboxylase